jgi:hypothetical protein
MTEKTLGEAKSPDAADYRSAWRACGKFVPGEDDRQFLWLMAADADTIAKSFAVDTARISRLA